MEFRSKIAGFLCDMNLDLLTDMLRGVGRPVRPTCISKHICPPRLVYHSQWSRSELWFLIRVAIRLSLDSLPPSLGHDSYKAFMLFFMCNLANRAVNTPLSSILLYSMSAKILRRFKKFGSSVPKWLHDVVLRTCTSISRTLDERSREVRCTSQSSSNWDPSLLDVAKDVQHSLPHIHDYVSTSLADSDDSPAHTPFIPNSRPRGTLNDFLSDPTWLSKGRDDDGAHVTLYDVERAVGEDIDDWVACVTDVDEACEQLERLAHEYYSLALDTYRRKRGEDEDEDEDNVDNLSIMLLTITDLWVALDKLVVKKLPLLANYFPESPGYDLSKLLLRDTRSIQRLYRANQYFSSRFTRMVLHGDCGGRLFSDNFTKDSFPCRYYDTSPQLQRLRARIEDALPPEPLHAKVVVFELECPKLFDTWRSVACWISRVYEVEREPKNSMQVCDIPELKPYSCSYRGRLSLYSSPSAPQSWGRLYYGYEGPSVVHDLELAYKLPEGPYAASLQRYLNTPYYSLNGILADQANCHSDISLPEFIAFAHLRSTSSLLWFNILRELRSRTLDFRCEEVYLLFAQAFAQVGPFDRKGTLKWHQELQDVLFCHALLDELETLFVDVGAGSLDGPGMAIISLLASVLVSRHSGDISERAIQLLRDVRRKTFSWVHEVLCDVAKSPTKNESLQLLRDMAAICRSTFDMGFPTSCRLFCSAQDVEIALSCSMLIHTTPTTLSGMSDPQIDSDTIDFYLLRCFYVLTSASGSRPSSLSRSRGELEGRDSSRCFRCWCRPCHRSALVRLSTKSVPVGATGIAELSVVSMRHCVYRGQTLANGAY